MNPRFPPLAVPRRLLISLLLLLLLPACGLLRQPASAAAEETPTPPAALRVSADQLARAMQEDHFFSDYTTQSLLVTGTISFVSQQGSSQMVGLTTSLTTNVVCDLGSRTTALRAGDPVTVSAKASEAQRGDNSVVLKNCAIP